MKQKLFLGGIIFLVIGFILFSCFTFYNEKIIINNSYNSNRFNKSLSMMIETDANSGMYEESKDSLWPQAGYTFNSSLSKCENGSTLIWDNATKKVIMNGNISDKCYVYFDAPQPLLADYIKSLYTSQGAGGLYLHDASLANSANDNSYRYAGKSPNNYVCFGSDAVPCPVDNLYRIIGVFGDQVKLIKYDYATTSQLETNGAYNIDIYYYWNQSGNNNWNESKLNTINLNINFLNKFDATTKNKIATTTWKVGGNTWSNIGTATAPNAYKNEIVMPAANTTYNAKIGLMYVSDYGFAADPSAWTTTLGSYNGINISTKSWMFMGEYEWTISRRSDVMNNAFSVGSSGSVNYSGVNGKYYNAVRPVFYINQWELYDSGDGTKENPIRMKSPDNLIAFTISDFDGSNTIQYYAENGMTWEQFVNSKYNTDGLVIRYGYVCRNEDKLVEDLNSVIEPNDYILMDHSGGVIG